MVVFIFRDYQEKKQNNPYFIIMTRSISEVDMLKDKDDKLKYLSLVKKYQKLYKFRVMATA